MCVCILLVFAFFFAVCRTFFCVLFANFASFIFCAFVKLFYSHFHFYLYLHRYMYVCLCAKRKSMRTDEYTEMRNKTRRTLSSCLTFKFFLICCCCCFYIHTNACRVRKKCFINFKNLIFWKKWV